MKPGSIRKNIVGIPLLSLAINNLVISVLHPMLFINVDYDQ